MQQKQQPNVLLRPWLLIIERPPTKAASIEIQRKAEESLTRYLDYSHQHLVTKYCQNAPEINQ